MAFDHGKGAAFKLDNSGGTLTDISAYVNNVDFSWEADAAETTVFSNNDRTYIVGLRNATLSVSGYWESATFDPIAGAVVGASATLSFEYGPQGGSSGAIKYSGECIVTNYSVSAPVDGVVSYTLDLQVTGAVTRGTF